MEFGVEPYFCESSRRAIFEQASTRIRTVIDGLQEDDDEKNRFLLNLSIVPTLLRGNVARGRSAFRFWKVTQSVTGCIPTQSVGTIKYVGFAFGKDVYLLSRVDVIQHPIRQQRTQFNQLLNA